MLVRGNDWEVHGLGAQKPALGQRRASAIHSRYRFSMSWEEFRSPSSAAQVHPLPSSPLLAVSPSGVIATSKRSGDSKPSSATAGGLGTRTPDNQRMADVFVVATALHRNRDIFPSSAAWFILDPKVRVDCEGEGEGCPGFGALVSVLQRRAIFRLHTCAFPCRSPTPGPLLVRAVATLAQNTFFQWWHAVLAVLLLFTALVTPFEVAFLHVSLSSINGLFVINRIVDAGFLLVGSFSLTYWYL